MTRMPDRRMQRRYFARLAAGVAAASVAGCFHEADPEPGAPANGDIDPDDDEPEDEDEDGGPLDDQDDEDDQEEPPDLSAWQDVEEIRLEADADGWVGLEPEPIADQENPVLIVFIGREYTITIENADGQEHDLRIENAAGDIVDDYESDSVEEEGDEASVEIEATEEMVLYYCSYHEQSMAGELRTEEDRDFSDPEDDAGGRNITDDATNETDDEGN